MGKCFSAKDEMATYSIGNVVVEPGCCNNCHTHAAGQTSVVLDGNGWYKEKGKPERALRKGDVVIVHLNLNTGMVHPGDDSLTHLAHH